MTGVQPAVAVIRGLAAIVSLIGAVVLAGWAADVPAMTGGLAGWPAARPNSAVALLAVGMALWLLPAAPPRRLAVTALGAFAGLVGLVTLVEYAGDVNLHIDQLLFTVRDPGATPGRMAGLTAVALTLLGAGVVAAAANRTRLVQVSGLASFAIGYVALVGYALDAQALYSVDGYKRMSLLTASAVTVAASGVLVSRPSEGLVGQLTRPGPAGRLTRRMVPFALVGAAGLGALVVWGERAEVFRPRFGSALLVVSFAATALALAWRAAAVIGRGDKARQASAAELRELTEQLQGQVETLVTTSPDAIITVSAGGTIVAANDHASQMFGVPIGRLTGQPVETLLPERLRDMHAGHRSGYISRPQLRPMGTGFDLVGRRGDGSEFPVAVSLAPLPGKTPLVLATVRDLTELRATEAAAAESAHRFAAAFDDAPVGMLLVDLDGTIRQANAALAILIGAAPEALAGQDLMTLIDPRDVDDDLADRVDLLAGRIHRYQREIRLLDVDGAPIWTLINTALVDDAEGEPSHLVLHVEDIRGRKQYEGRLQYLSDHDPLTGLFNRRRFDQELSRHLAEHARYGGDGAVLLLDLDNFKYVNDTLGHSAGDALIREVATALRHRIRHADILARLGGDEFAVLLPAADVTEAQTVAAALLDAIRADGVTGTGAVAARTTASLGIAMLRDIGDEQSAEVVLAAADLAMYGAKDEGRDRAVVYDPTGPHLARAQAQFHWLHRIRTALERDQLTLQAQPIVEVATGRVTQVELLLRMREGETLIPPGRFLYIAERQGLGPAIDRWVIDQAIGYAATLTDPDAPRVEINLCADSLADSELPEHIAGLLAEHGVPADRMVFEVTETAAIANIDTAVTFVEQLEAYGCTFALDDFGAGFGSFYYLKYLPFDYLKIDGEFIRQLTTSRTDQLIVTSIVAAARGLGKKTIAEYVGDAETFELLRRLKVDYAQGYHLGRPAPLPTPIPPQRSARDDARLVR